MQHKRLSPKKALKREEFGFALGTSSHGMVLVAASEFGIVAVLTGARREKLILDLQSRFPKISMREGAWQAEAALARVLAYIKKPDAPFDLPLNMRGTLFQRKVWQAVQEIPAGETSTYSEIARKIGAPRAMRAVGSACTRNPFSIVVPCQRVLHKAARSLQG